MSVIRFALLGLGAGAVYALAAQGIVLVYRGSGVLNFAHGAVGMVGAYFFYHQRESGTSTTLALLLALGFGFALGAGFHLLVMRPMRRAPAISRLIATLGLLTVLLAVGQRRWGDTPDIVAKLLPVDGVELFADTVVGKDRLIILGIVTALTVVLMLVYRYTRFGLATTAVAENRRATSAQGISPDVVASVNWGLGTALAVLAAVLIVNITGLQVVSLTLLVVPALAAALVGSFRSFPLTLAGGLLIGILESEVAYLQVRIGPSETLQGLSASIPFLVIILVLVVRGRALPLRGEAAEQPPEIGTGRVRPDLLVPALAVVLGLTWLSFSDSMIDALTITAATAVVTLSLVVLTGYGGQLSLAQFALAGMGGWMAARLVANFDVPHELALLAGVIGAVPIGIVVGLPALRTRGVNLAVVTLGLALVLERMVLRNSERTGGIAGTQVGSPRFFGIDFDTFAHPERYAAFAVGVFVVLALAVANLRRGRAGRRLVAVRTNERAAAALGISVFGAKLYAFGLSAAIAGAGGVLLAFRRPTVVFIPTFAIFESIYVVLYGVIGGIGFLLGPLAGASLAPSGLVPRIAGDVLDSDTVVKILLGVLLVAVLLWAPNGLASIPFRRLPGVRWLLGLRRPPAPASLRAGERPRVEPRTLDVRGLTVRFGGVVAVDNVSLRVEPGQVVGLIGPNGAGKTTLIDAVTGFVRPAGGEVVLDGASVNRWSARRRAVAGMGRSFQGLELFETMSVRDNLLTASDRRDALAYLTDLVRPGRGRLGPAAAAAVSDFELAEDLDRRVDELSYGRRRLVAIARAIATEPSVLLLDEPAAGLDPVETEELGRLVRRLADEWGLAVLLVEHDVKLVLDVCDRVAVLDFGRRIAEGEPDVVRHDPLVVAAYLGVPAAEEPSGELAPVEPVAAGPASAPVGVREPVRVGERVPAADPPPRPDGAPLVEARGLSAGYGDLAAVRDLDLVVRPGEVVALLGPNGAGKTTTLLTLAGELAPLAGEVRWLGSTRRAPLHRRVRAGLGFVPEERSVIMSLTAGGNLRLGRGSAAAACEMFPELSPLLRRRAGLLSGGEQQILTLARALAAEPRLLLADELSLGLAPMVVDRLLACVREAADRGVGVLLVEQRARDALDVADRVYVLRQGAVQLEAEAADLAGRFDDLERAYLSGTGAD